MTNPRSNFTRRCALIGGLGLSAAALAACTPGGTPASDDSASSDGGGDGAITFWHYYGGAATAPIEALVKRYTEETGVEVDIRYIPFGDFNRTLLQAATGDGLPDIALVNAFDTALFADSGMLLDLSDRVTEWGQQDSYFAGPWATTQVEGATFGLPHVADTYALWTNTAALEAAGAKAPTTWAETEEAAIAASGDGTFGLAFCGINGVEGATAWLLRFLAAGGDVTEFASEAGTTAMESFQRLLQDGGISEGVLTWNEDDTYTQFRSEAAAMMINSASYLTSLAEEAPDLKFEVLPMPADAINVSWLSAENLTITSSASNPDAAWELLTWMQQPEVMNEYLPDRNKLPVRTDTAEDEQWQEPIKKVFVDQLEVAWAPDEEVAPASAEIFTAAQLAMQSVLSGSTSVDAALTELQKATDDALGA
ncbi:ABC transporter substrate-binding protein [Brachybacterium sp. GU-2]|uniref:ABC transporter substrate-binding protein n=1 Tax=Brachybacterium sp. GU-2 TaxID=3069708 RepID=UPI00280AD7D8|nr:sugar ABC transporter substrate-binding protein [Brachybacterium sp. GU-2]WME24447.1 sugar ABC transporter substrate-binding protein [Brachybacterium sp. GU-2]